MHAREQVEGGKVVASEQQQAERAFKRLVRKRPLVALLLAVALLAAASLGWWGTTGAGDANGTSADRGAQATASDAALEQAEVVRVVDGDTLKVKTADGSEERVRLVGMDTPESVAEEESRNCEEGVIAANYTKSLVAPGQTVWLSRDVSDTDQYGRLLRYVWLERPSDPASESEIAGKMLNAILVRDGYAQVKRYKPDTTLYDTFKHWGDEAVAEGKGVTSKWA